MKADKKAYEDSLLAKPPPSPSSPKPTTSTSESETPQTPQTTKFTTDAVTVIFVLGGPGAGKGTQCLQLKTHHNFHHLSAGDLLREEQQRKDSPYGELIRSYIRDGKIVPMEVTVALLANAMQEVITTKGGDKGGNNKEGNDSNNNTPTKFLIDGFPRELAQAHFFEQTVCPGKLVLFFETSEEVMLQRLLKRGETSGREDDNLESIRKRFRTFVGQSMPVVEYYEGLGKVVRVDASRPVEVVRGDVERRLGGWGVLE
ncbi:uridylate kinase [Peziza echinospora]|nr:uridylate kinase [Peziza echinospora]